MAREKGVEPGAGAIARARANRVDQSVNSMAAGGAPMNSEKRARNINEPNPLMKALYNVAPSLSPRAREQK